MAALCVSIHRDLEALAATYWDKLGRKVFVTPSSFIEFLENVRILLAEKREFIQV